MGLHALRRLSGGVVIVSVRGLLPMLALVARFCHCSAAGGDRYPTLFSPMDHMQDVTPRVVSTALQIATMVWRTKLQRFLFLVVIMFWWEPLSRPPPKGRRQEKEGVWFLGCKLLQFASSPPGWPLPRGGSRGRVLVRRGPRSRLLASHIIVRTGIGIGVCGLLLGQSLGL